MDKLGARTFIVFLHADNKWQLFDTKVGCILDWESRLTAVLLKRNLLYALQKPFWIRNWPES